MITLNLVIIIVKLVLSKLSLDIISQENDKYAIAKIRKLYRSSNFLYLPVIMDNILEQYVLNINSNINWLYQRQGQSKQRFPFYISPQCDPQGNKHTSEIKIAEFVNQICQIAYLSVYQTQEQPFPCPYYASIGLSMAHEDESYSIINKCAEKCGFNKQFSIELTSFAKGNLTFGINSHIIDMNVTQIICNSDYNSNGITYWGCKLQGVFIGANNTITHLYKHKSVIEINHYASNYYQISNIIIFETTQRLIIVSKHFFNYLIKIMFTELSNDSKCKFRNENSMKLVVCAKNEIWDLPSINFIFDNKVLSLSRNDLFEEDDEYYDIFRLVSREEDNDDNPWIFGHLLLERYKLTFDIENKHVIISPQTNSNINSIKELQLIDATKESSNNNCLMINIKYCLIIIILIQLIGIMSISVFKFKIVK